MCRGCPDVPDLLASLQASYSAVLGAQSGSSMNTFMVSLARLSPSCAKKVSILNFLKSGRFQ